MLEKQQKNDNILQCLMIFWQWYLNTEIATVNVVSKEQVPCCGWWSTHFKQLHEIKELPVDVPTHWKTTRGQQTLQNLTGYLCLHLRFIFVCDGHKDTHSSCSAHVCLIGRSFWQSAFSEAITVVGRKRSGLLLKHTWKINRYSCKCVVTKHYKDKPFHIYLNDCCCYC